jgi:hypothetical protein
VDLSKYVSIAPEQNNNAYALFIAYHNLQQKSLWQSNTRIDMDRHRYVVDGFTSVNRSQNTYELKNGAYMEQSNPLQDRPQLPFIGVKYIRFQDNETVVMNPMKYDKAYTGWGDVLYSAGDSEYLNANTVLSHYGSNITAWSFKLFQYCACWIKYGHASLQDVTNSFMLKSKDDSDATTANSLHKWWFTYVYEYRTSAYMSLKEVSEKRTDGATVVQGWTYRGTMFFSPSPTNVTYIPIADRQVLINFLFN